MSVSSNWPKEMLSSNGNDLCHEYHALFSDIDTNIAAIDMETFRREDINVLRDDFPNLQSKQDSLRQQYLETDDILSSRSR